MALLPFPQNSLTAMLWPSDVIEYFRQLHLEIEGETLQKFPIPVTSVTGTSGSEQTLFTAPANGDVRLVALTVNNPDASPHTVTVNIVPDGGSVATTNEAVSAMNFAARTSDTVIADLVLTNSDVVKVSASTTAKLVVYGWYEVVT